MKVDFNELLDMVNRMEGIGAPFNKVKPQSRTVYLDKDGSLLNPLTGASSLKMELETHAVHKENISIIQIAVPYIKKEDINAKIENGVLTIVAEAPEDHPFAISGTAEFSVQDKEVNIKYDDYILVLTLTSQDRSEEVQIF